MNEIFYGQWNPPEDKVAYINYFLNERDGFFIEAGAGNFGNACRFFASQRGWKGLCIEPSKYAYSLLKENSLVDTLWGALDNAVGYKKFTDIVSAPGGGNDNGSLQHTTYHKKELDSYRCVYETYEVPIYTYKDIIKNYNIEHVDYLSLDVEGNELSILSSMMGCARFLPDIMCIEYPYVGLENLKNSCKNLGYEFNFVSFNNAFFSRIGSFVANNNWYGATEPMKDLL